MKNNWKWAFLLIILIAYGFYIQRFIQRTSFVMDGERYYALLDEAMVSMRYAKNLANGKGLTWNGGERIEGFGSPVWVGFMTVVHLFPIATQKTSLFIQLCSAGLLMLNLVFVKKIGDETENGMKWYLPLGGVFLTAFYYSLNLWALEGLDVALSTTILTATLWFSIRNLRLGKFSLLPYVMVGVGTLVRIDMAIPYLAILVSLSIFDPQNRQKHILWGLSILMAFLALQTFGRLVYFREIVPNGFIVKFAGASPLALIKRGIKVYWQFIWESNWILFLIPFVLLILKPRKETGLLLFVFLAQSAYSIAVGGDAWEDKGGANRFITLAMPGFLLLMVYGFGTIRETVMALSEKRTRFIETSSKFLLIPVIIFALFSLNDLNEADILEKWTLQKRPILTKETERLVKQAKYIRELTTENALIAAAQPGNIAYFSNRNVVDLLGMNDKTLALLKPRNTSGLDEKAEFRPHNSKWDYGYSIEKLKPDVVAHLWAKPQEAEPYLKSGYFQVTSDGNRYYFRTDSPNVLWEELITHK